MAKQKFKINLFDLFAIFIVVAFCVIFCVAHKNQTYLGSRNVLVEVHVTDNNIMVKSALPMIKKDPAVYYGGTQYTVKTISYNGTDDDFYITVEGLGDIKTGESTFEGQRIYVNQKTELRGDYSLQGYVTKFYYSN